MYLTAAVRRRPLMQGGVRSAALRSRASSARGVICRLTDAETNMKTLSQPLACEKVFVPRRRPEAAAAMQAFVQRTSISVRALVEGARPLRAHFRY